MYQTLATRFREVRNENSSLLPVIFGPFTGWLIGFQV